MESLSLQGLEDIRVLREQTEKSAVVQSIKKAVVGGFDKKSVLQFIDRLKKQQDDARETFGRRIRELEDALREEKSNAAQLGLSLAEETEKGRRAAELLGQMREENRRLQKRAESGENLSAGLQKQCVELRQKVEEMTPDFEALRAAQDLQARFDELQADYKALSQKHEETAKENAALAVRLDEAGRENSRLKTQSEELAALRALLRTGRQDLETDWCEFGEKQERFLKSLTEQTENTLQTLHSLSAAAQENGKRVREHLDGLR